MTLNSLPVWRKDLKFQPHQSPKRDFYKIPLDYLVTDEDTNEEGFYKYIYDENNEMKAAFYKSDIYTKDDEFCYVDTSDFELGGIMWEN